MGGARSQRLQIKMDNATERRQQRYASEQRIERIADSILPLTSDDGSDTLHDAVIIAARDAIRTYGLDEAQGEFLRQLLFERVGIA